MTPRLLVAGLVALLCAATASAQQGLPTLPANGSELFRFALHQQDIQPVTVAREAVDQAPRTIIIVRGNTNDLHHHIRSGHLLGFVARGGALLILTDGPNKPPSDEAGPNADAGWGATFGALSVTGRRITAPLPSTYGNVASRPYVHQLPRVGLVRNDETPHSLFDGLLPFGETGVATDSPSGMRVPGQMPNLPYPRAYWIANYPLNARVQGQPLPHGDNNFAIAFESLLRGGRALFLADREVFANGMMGFRPADDDRGYRLDNANWEFAKRTINWLQLGGRERRTRCLFIEEGQIVEKFADKLTPPAPPFPNLPPDVLANILLNNANPIIDEAQRQNYFNRMVQSAFGFDRIVRYFLIVCTILFLFFGLRWLRRAYRKAEPAVGNPAREASQVPRGGVVSQRTAAQIEVGNLYEAAARRIRDRFDVLGGRPAGANVMPPMLVAVDVADAPILKHTVGWLWTIGYGETPVAVPPVEWDRVNGLLERVTARAARGDWTFGADA